MTTAMTTATTATPLLEVERLCIDYLSEGGAVHAVSEVSFTLRRGEILGLAGESGCGKSTLAYAVARLLRPPALVTQGAVRYHPRARPDGDAEGLTVEGVDLDPARPVDVLALSPAQLRAFRWSDLAIVFQSAMNALNPVTTLGAQIDDVLRAHRPRMKPAERTARAAELLGLVGIASDRLGSYPHELSGGMRQRAIIAIALALNPDIIIMDEPTTALDVVVQREILTQIKRLQGEFNFAVIFITHDLSLLLEMADTIAIMYAGRIVERATQRELYVTPRHPYSFGLINSFPPLRGPRRRVAGIPGSPPDLRNVPQGCAFHPRCPFAFAPCLSELPLLRAARPGAEQQVACHLYDPRHAAQPPTTPELAARYESLAARSGRA
jgi:peptide/nickel transport system ATP-binding protein